MSNVTFRIGSLLAAASWISFTSFSTAYGQSANGGATNSTQSPITETVIVTATRTGIAASDAPAAVEVFGAVDIRNRDSFRIGDVLRDSPSIFFRGSPFGGTTPGSGQGGFSIRGIGGPRSIVMIDGQRLNSGYSNNVNWSSIQMNEVDHIELVPGAFSALWGGDALGGVVNVITKVPSERQFNVDVGYITEAFVEKKVQAAYRDHFANGIGVSLTGGYTSNDSYVQDFVIKAPTTGAGTGCTSQRGQLVNDCCRTASLQCKIDIDWKWLNFQTMFLPKSVDPLKMLNKILVCNGTSPFTDIEYLIVI